jgi:hypothetical protein
MRLTKSAAVVFMTLVVLTTAVDAQGPSKTVVAPAFQGTNTTGPDFIANATSGPPFQVSSTVQVNNLNVDFLNGFHASAFARLGVANIFTANQTVNGTLTAISFSGNGSALTGVRPDIPSTRSHFSGSPFAVPPSSDQHHAVPVDWNDVQYDTLGATQTSPWRYVAPTSGRYRVSSFIRYTPNGPIAAGQVVQVEVFVNGTLDYGATGGFQADTATTGTADLFLQGEDEIPVNAGDQITINIFQNTAQTGFLSSASHILVERVGDLDGATTEPWN